ncbi:MAG: enoyl-CoA hydratase/isomerase family protein [Acidobacteria bacterium]|nr:enoyl-CoA hydratase/isomerase family protein [Acidobacteriota bacterium]
MTSIAGLRHVSFELREGGIGLLTIDRPPVNALGRELVEDLNTACAALESGSDVRALVIAARGKAFCAGADLKERQTMSEDDVRAWVPYLSGTFTRLSMLPMPAVAAVHGVVAGGGLELALACDLRVADEGATLGLREVSLGIIPGAGGTQRLPRAIGVARAKKWIFTARMFSAAEALADGVVDQLAAPGASLEAALALAMEIAANGPLALRAAKRAVDRGCEMPIEEGLREETAAYESIIPTQDRVEALRAFVEKRKPQFKGR